QVEAGVAGSPEYFQSRGGGTVEGFLNALYDDALGRDVDAAGLAGWGRALANGVSRAQVAALVFARPEFPGELVRTYSDHFLPRSADVAGFDVWLSALEQGTTDAEVVAGIVGSPEYLNRPT